MFPVNYRSPDTLPTSHRDFPPRNVTANRHVNDGGLLLFMVAGYLLALFVGVALLASFAAVSDPNVVAVDEPRNFISIR